MSILNELGKEVYIADYNELGASACRILVPEYSEIYNPEDLIWDNHNQALDYREDILNLHSLNNNQLRNLLEKLEDSELDNYMPISELIGIAFDESTVWGQLVIGELKALSFLALKELDEAKHLVEMLGTFNDNTIERRRFYQALNIALDIELGEDLTMENYQDSLSRMYGEELVDRITKTINGENRFDGLTKTSLNLEGIDKHLKLIESYKKLQLARHNFLK